MEERFRLTEQREKECKFIIHCTLFMNNSECMYTLHSTITVWKISTTPIMVHANDYNANIYIYNSLNCTSYSNFVHKLGQIFYRRKKKTQNFEISRYQQHFETVLRTCSVMGYGLRDAATLFEIELLWAVRVRDTSRIQCFNTYDSIRCSRSPESPPAADLRDRTEPARAWSVR